MSNYHCYRACLCHRSPVVKSALAFFLFPFAFLLLPAAARAIDDVIDSPMYMAPNPPAPEEITVYVGDKELWLRALARSEAEMKCRAAEAIVLARRHGVKGLEPTVAPLLVEFDRPNQHPTVRLAVAQALTTLDAREAAPSFLRIAQSGDGDLRCLVEPALARWDDKAARAAWLARLGEPTSSTRSLLLAIQGLVLVREVRAVDPLRELVLADRAPRSIQLEAARALGYLRTEGLEKDAERLVGDTSTRGVGARLAAVSLLGQHRSEASIRLLQRLAQDSEPVVAARAVRRLLEIDSKLVTPALERLLASPDAKLHMLAVDFLHREPTEERVHALAGRLDDHDPDVRTKARQALQDLGAKKEFRDRVIAEAAAALAGDQWRSLEQAAVLLAQLEHKPAAGRLVELLTFDRPEVYISAAWALRKLAVPDTLPAVLRYVETKQRQLRANADHPDVSFAFFDRQLSQLNQLLGQQKFEPADKALREFVPRMERPMQNGLCPESRAAAIWALGLIHESEAPPELTVVLEERLNDVQSLPREDGRVSRMSAVALGRMKAKEALPSLRRYCMDQKPSLDPIHNACGWAIEQITGKVMQAPEAIRREQLDRFFLIASE
jgi:HEAT repeat protein